MQIDIKQLEFIHPKLRELVMWLEEDTGLVLTITSLYRVGDEGLHGTLPLRAIDLRMRNEAVGCVITSLINISWTYDPARFTKNCAILHGDGSNMHLHLQVHDDTYRVYT